MHIPYNDIYRRIPEPPKWWLDGVPRYDEFTPDDVSVYAREVALVRVECQPDPAVIYEIAVYSPSPEYPYGLKNEIMGTGILWTHDPPNHENPNVVPHMSTWPLEIVQFWSRPDLLRWEREPRFEIAMPDLSEPFRGAIARAHDADGAAWSEAIAACDFARVRDMLAAVGCERPVGIARLAIFRALEGSLRLKMHQATKDFPPDE